MSYSKTNAMRLLDQAKVPYTVHGYDGKDGTVDGESVAAELGVDPAVVFKTLACVGAQGDVYIFCLPANHELPLKKAAALVGEKSLRLLPLKELTKTTGYRRGGCSPLAMRRAFPTYIHQSATEHDAIFINAGKVGLQIKLNAADLKPLIEAEYFTL